MDDFDFIVIGAGIAGASVAAHLADGSRVLLLERETHAGYHSTGRSAALFSEIYGNEVIRVLTRASRDFLFAPPAAFCDTPLVRGRGSLFIASADQLESLDSYAALPDIVSATRRIDTAEAMRLCPVLRETELAGALLEPASSDLDVNALHQSYLRQFRSRGGHQQNDAAVDRLRHDGKCWRVSVGATHYSAPVIINAAGAWADEIAKLADLAPLGLQPRRRTALLVDTPPDIDATSWPMVIDIDEQFYLKPDAARLLISPADESPVEPGDAQPDEWDVATAVDRIENATTLRIDRIAHRWAGLRTFAPDRSPVVGFSRKADGFFWLAGQGGYGIQTAPAMGRTAAALARGLGLPDDLFTSGLREEHLSPARLESTGCS